MTDAVPTTRYAKWNDIHVAYQQFGEGSHDLLFLPGWFSHVEVMWEVPDFRRLMERLRTSFRVLTFDRPGVGMSDRVALEQLPAMQDTLDLVETVLDDAGVERTHLLGNSEGGSMALAFAARAPERTRSVIVHGTWACFLRRNDYPAGITVEQADHFGARTHDAWGSGDTLKVFAPSLADDPAMRETWGRLERLAASPGVIRGYLELMKQLDIRDLLPRIDAPTLVLHQTGDLVVPVANGHYLRDHLPNATYVELEGTDHATVGPSVEAIADEVERFVLGAASSTPDRRLGAVLFTDIVGSTELATAIGDDRWRRDLEAHDARCRSAVADHGGRVIKHTGDGMLALFPEPRAALRCAARLHRSVGELDLQLRAGMHIGEVEHRGDDISGVAVHLAARIADLATAGQTLVSSTVRDLLIGSDLDFEDTGEHELKGIPGTWRTYAVS